MIPFSGRLRNYRPRISRCEVCVGTYGKTHSRQLYSCRAACNCTTQVIPFSCWVVCVNDLFSLVTGTVQVIPFSCWVVCVNDLFSLVPKPSHSHKHFHVICVLLASNGRLQAQKLGMQCVQCRSSKLPSEGAKLLGPIETTQMVIKRSLLV